MKRLARRLLVPAALLLSAVLVAPAAQAVGVTPSARAQSASDARPIRPGVQMLTAGAQCTANFVYRDTTKVKHKVRKKIPRNKRHKYHGHKYRTVTVVRTRTRTYVGYAAHCAGQGSSSDTDGCSTPSLPLGTRVDFVSGGSQGLLSSEAGTTVGHGTLRYSSWLAMQRAGTTDPATCAYNDLALVQVDRADLARVDPTVPVLGGPTAVAALPAVGGAVYSYGSSSLRSDSSVKSGTVRSLDGPWSASVRTSPSGIPGDSGSGYLDSRGRAIGVLSTLSIFPDTGANGVGSLALEMGFARRHGLRTLRLVPGAPFVGAGGARVATGGGGSLLGGLLG